jgi:hypothetical protein
MPRRKSVDAKPRPKHTVLRDSLEKDDSVWPLPATQSCEGTVIRTLPTGEYTLEGLESRFAIDRKWAVSKFATKVFDASFGREPERMESCDLPVVLLEFELSGVGR